MSFSKVFTIIIGLIVPSCSYFPLMATQVAIGEDISYECIFNKGGRASLDPADPYQFSFNILPHDLQKLYENRSLASVLRIGDYEIYKDVRLGGGDDGQVYLAKNTQGIFVAAKSRGMSNIRNEKGQYMIQEYQNLLAIGRLQAAYTTKKRDHLYLIMPFVNGTQISGANLSTLSGIQEIENSLYLNSKGVNLANSYIAELSFLAKKGVLHPDLESVNVMVDSQNHKVVTIDFGFSGDCFEGVQTKFTSITHEEYDIGGMGATYYLRLLGIDRDTEKKIQAGEIKAPKEVIDLIKLMDVKIKGSESEFMLSWLIEKTKSLKNSLSNISYINQPMVAGISKPVPATSKTVSSSNQKRENNNLTSKPNNFLPPYPLTKIGTPTTTTSKTTSPRFIPQLVKEKDTPQGMLHDILDIDLVTFTGIQNLGNSIQLSSKGVELADSYLKVLTSLAQKGLYSNFSTRDVIIDKQNNRVVEVKYVAGTNEKFKSVANEEYDIGGIGVTYYLRLLGIDRETEKKIQKGEIKAPKEVIDLIKLMDLKVKHSGSEFMLSWLIEKGEALKASMLKRTFKN